MRETQWIEWTRTRLQPQEREELLTALTSEQKAHLLEHDYVWLEGIGVLWKPRDGDLLRRARFTHGTHFHTQRGEFYIDSAGSARELSDHRIDPPTPTARPGIPEMSRDPTTSGAAAVSITRSPVSTPGSSAGVGGAQNAEAT